MCSMERLRYSLRMSWTKNEHIELFSVNCQKCPRGTWIGWRTIVGSNIWEYGDSHVGKCALSIYKNTFNMMIALSIIFLIFYMDNRYCCDVGSVISYGALSRRLTGLSHIFVIIQYTHTDRNCKSEVRSSSSDWEPFSFRYNCFIFSDKFCFERYLIVLHHVRKLWRMRRSEFINVFPLNNVFCNSQINICNG